MFLSPGRSSASGNQDIPYSGLVSASGSITNWLALKTPNSQTVTFGVPSYGYSCVAVASQFAFFIGGRDRPAGGTSFSLRANPNPTFDRDFVSSTPNSLGAIAGLPGSNSVMGDCVVTRGNVYIVGGNADGYGGAVATNGLSFAGL